MVLLRDLLVHLGDLDDDATLYATVPWSAESDATSAEEGSAEAEEAVSSGHTYLLEVAIAREVIETWRLWRQGRSPTPAEAANAVIYYALNDAYLPQ
jgi:hypothetical protein